VLNHEMFENAKIRIMPDCHSGKGCVIGFTAPITGKICPNLIGVDIGCGMTSYIVKATSPELDFAKSLEDVIRAEIPSGRQVNTRVDDRIEKLDLNQFEDIVKRSSQKTQYAKLSLGSLGGGNHFIECGKLDDNNYVLTVHSGSRNFGLSIARYHQKIATEESLNKGYPVYLGWLEGDKAQQYLKDMRFAQKYASLNRSIMLEKIINKLNLQVVDKLESIHNYIGEDNLIRKGAISAKKGEKVIIPWNMRDGLIIGEGKGNEDWNFSAPHGAGRIMSRSKAKEELDLEKFKIEMEGIYSTCVRQSTLDESPMSYKPYQEVEKYLSESVEITHRIKPFYNFKA